MNMILATIGISFWLVTAPPIGEPIVSGVPHEMGEGVSKATLYYDKCSLSDNGCWIVPLPEGMYIEGREVKGSITNIDADVSQ